MAIHKIQINDFISTDYELIAIHAAIEDYRLAYLINNELEIRLSKNSLNIEIENKEGKSEFSHFVFDDEINDIVWNLIENRTTLIPFETTNTGIFDSIDVRMYVIPEFKKADFILKIENIEGTLEIEDILNAISNIKQISMAYIIDQVKLKSKHNLIF